MNAPDGTSNYPYDAYVAATPSSRERGRRRLAVATGTLLALSLGGTIGVAAVAHAASSSGTTSSGTTSSTSSTSSSPNSGTSSSGSSGSSGSVSLGNSSSDSGSVATSGGS